MDEREEKTDTGRRDFLRKLGLGAAAVTVPAALGGCVNPYLHH